MPGATRTRPRGRSRSRPSTIRPFISSCCPSSCHRVSAGPAKAAASVLPRLLEQEHALLVGSDDIEQSIAVEVGDDELGADPALVVDLAGCECDLAIGGTARLEPVELRRLVRAGLIGAVRPEP